MFIYNLKINGTKAFKILFIIFVIISLVILGLCIYRIFNGANNNFFVSDQIDESQIMQITDKNYTNVLKSVHDNIDEYIGKNVKMIGYVYRVNDLESNQFVIARNMLINNNSQYVIVGFLCDYKNSNDLKNNSWIELSGQITKGAYHGLDMPIIKVTNTNTVDKPSNEYVLAPSNDYIPTSTVF